MSSPERRRGGGVVADGAFADPYAIDPGCCTCRLVGEEILSRGHRVAGRAIVGRGTRSHNR